MNEENSVSLADRIVALGVGEFLQGNGVYKFIDAMSAKRFERDWRVAGVLMEKAFLLLAHDWDEFYTAIVTRMDSESIHELPRVISEICVDKLEAV